MLLSRECGVQTEPSPTPAFTSSPRQPQHLAPNLYSDMTFTSSRPSTSTAHSIHSSTNSDRDLTAFSPTSNLQALTEQPHTPMTTLSANLSSLLTKLHQADISTIHTRLRRQHLSLTKESLRHVSDTTLKALESSVKELVLPTHGLLSVDGDRPARWEGAWVGRDEWRSLLGWCRNVLLEAVSLRAHVNDAELKEFGKDKDTGSWIKPISRLFSGTHAESNSNQPSNQPNPTPPRNFTSPRPVRPPPKLQPALAPSTTTVNVEFTGSGLRHSTPGPEAQLRREFQPPPSIPEQPATSNTSTTTTSVPNKDRTVRDIFAGSRMGSVNGNEAKEWVVLPKKSSRVFRQNTTPSSQNTLRQDSLATIKRGRRMSRVLDAILDDPNSGLNEVDADDDTQETDSPVRTNEVFSPSRPLRPRGRGLSDSSIHTTFMTHGAQLDAHNITNGSSTIKDRYSGILPISILPDRGSMFQALSQRVQSLASSVSGGTGASSFMSPPPGAQISASTSNTNASNSPRERGRGMEIGVGSSPRFGHESRNLSRAREGLA